MKSNNNNIKSVLFAFLIILIIGCGTEKDPVLAQADRTGNGGSFKRLAERDELTNIGLVIVHDFETWASQLYPSINIELLKKIIFEAEYEFTDSVLFEDRNGVRMRVDAINNPELKKITINKSSWYSKTLVNEKKSLLLHELFGLLRVLDQNYVISGDYLKKLKERTASLGQKSNKRIEITHGSRKNEGTLFFYGSELISNQEEELGVKSIARAIGRGGILGVFFYSAWASCNDTNRFCTYDFKFNKSYEQSSNIQLVARIVLDPSEGYCAPFGAARGNTSFAGLRGAASRIMEEFHRYDLITDYKMISGIPDPDCPNGAEGALWVEVEYLY